MDVAALRTYTIVYGQIGLCVFREPINRAADIPRKNERARARFNGTAPSLVVSGSGDSGSVRVRGVRGVRRRAVGRYKIVSFTAVIPRAHTGFMFLFVKFYGGFSPQSIIHYDVYAYIYSVRRRRRPRKSIGFQ